MQRRGAERPGRTDRQKDGLPWADTALATWPAPDKDPASTKVFSWPLLDPSPPAAAVTPSQEYFTTHISAPWRTELLSVVERRTKRLGHFVMSLLARPVKTRCMEEPPAWGEQSPWAAPWEFRALDPAEEWCYFNGQLQRLPRKVKNR